VDHPLPWLRYVDADDIDDNTIDFEGMEVKSSSGDHLGDVDGFIVDSESARPYYVVVDAGGWFKSKHFLLPIGHARFDTDADSLVADVTRDRVSKFPGFDKDEFDRLTVADLKTTPARRAASKGLRSSTAPTNRSRKPGAVRTSSIPTGGARTRPSRIA